LTREVAGEAVSFLALLLRLDSVLETRAASRDNRDVLIVGTSSGVKHRQIQTRRNDPEKPMTEPGEKRGAMTSAPQPKRAGP
jgi:hypothetical protein